MSKEYALNLPWPPSVNRLWRHVIVGRSVRTLVSRDGRQYKEDVQRACLIQNAPRQLKGDVVLQIKLEPPDRRRRDVDNSLKALLDALTSAGVWQDDSQVADIHIWRSSCVKDGRVVVKILTNC